MHDTIRSRLYALIGLAACFVLLASPARAQFRPRPLSDPATGERYHIEAAVGLWFPTAQMSISSESLGIVGTTIDFKRDLGLTDQRFPEVHLELRADRKHKFRFQYIPIKYEQTSTLTRDIVFNGQRYRIGLPVNSALDWKAYRFGYEFDVIRTQPAVRGLHPRPEADRRHAPRSQAVTPGRPNSPTPRAPIPAIGGIVRGLRRAERLDHRRGHRLQAAGEHLIEDTSGHYVDLDIYGTVNFTNNVGAQVGYRSLDVGYLVDTDTGSFTLKGMYFGIVREVLTASRDDSHARPARSFASRRSASASVSSRLQ